MKGTKILFRLGVSAIALVFMVLTGCASTGGGEYVAPTWSMEEAVMLPYRVKIGSRLDPDEEKKPLSGSVADGKDGVAIRQYAESANAKDGVMLCTYRAGKAGNELFMRIHRRVPGRLANIRVLANTSLPVACIG